MVFVFPIFIMTFKISAARPRTSGKKVIQGIGGRGSICLKYLYLSLFCPRPSQKTEPQVFVYFLLSNTHNMFQLTPWSHGIWFSTDKNIQRSQETGPNFHFLSDRKWKQGKKWVLNFNPSGVSVLSHFPSPPLSSNPSLLKIILQFPLEQGRLLPTGIAPWRSRPRGCCSWMVTTWD